MGFVDEEATSSCTVSTGVWVSVDMKRLGIGDRRLKESSWRPGTRCKISWRPVMANWNQWASLTLPQTKSPDNHAGLWIGLDWPEQLLRVEESIRANFCRAWH